MRRTGRILLVTPVFTNPPTQGNSARILAFGREMKARGFAIDVIYYALDSLTPEIEAAMREEWAEVRFVPASPHARQTYPAHWGLDDWCPDSLVAEVARAVGRRNYRAVIVNYVWLSRCFEVVDKPLRCLDTHDLFGGRHELSISAGMEPNWFFTGREEEARGFDRADIVLGIQSEETRRIAAMTKAAALTIGHPVPPYFVSHPDGEARLAQFGYFASGNPWNVRSIEAFDRAVQEQDIVLDWVLAGSICDRPPALRTPFLILGRLAAPEDFYLAVDCVLNPMVAGTGLKIKTVEALAYGRAVIGTWSAFEGLDPEHELHRLDTPQDCASAALAFASSAALRAELYSAGRELYGRYMSRLADSYDHLAALFRGDARTVL